MPGTSPGTTREVVPGRFLHVLLLGKGAKRVLLPGYPAPYAVMAGPSPGHPRSSLASAIERTWMPGTSARSKAS